MSKELIRLRDLCMAFDDELVLDHINLYINDSEFLTLLGPSGCGKTTTLRIIGGFTTPTSGDVTFDGVRINDVPPHKRQINTVFQKYALFPHLNVFENVAFGLRLKKMDEETIRRKVRDMLEVVGLKGFERRSIGQMSGGQKQRISIARAFLKNPPILLLDEATSALDNESERIVQASLEKLAKGRTTFTIAHRLTTIKNATKILVLTDKGIEEAGTHQELMKKKGIYFDLYKSYQEMTADTE